MKPSLTLPSLLLVVILGQASTAWWLDKRDKERATAQIEAEQIERLRLDNELRAGVWTMASHAGAPLYGGTIQSLPVRPLNLLEAFATDKGQAYLYRRVLMPVVVYKVEGNKVLWHVGLPSNPPAIECQFKELGEVKDRLWIEGFVSTVQHDGAERESPLIKFKLILTDCRLLQEMEK